MGNLLSAKKRNEEKAEPASHENNNFAFRIPSLAPKRINTTADENLRPAKRSKKENYELVFFLDSFPKEVLDNVLRYISGIPNAKNWEIHLDLRNLVELMDVRGELGSFIKSRFKTLCVSSAEDNAQETNMYGWDIRHHLWTNSMAIAHKFILAGGGESLETLVFGEHMFDIKRDGEGLINDFVEYCPNVTSLSIAEKGTSWVNGFGEQFEKLKLRTDFPIDFPVYSAKLREFTLSTYSDGDIPTELWQQIGCSLEKLNVYDIWLSENEIGDIKQYCRNLNNISLVGEDNEEKAAIAALLASYGGQLEYALLFKMDEVHLKEVADACPNARFHLEAYDMGVLFTGLNMFGSRLEFLTIWNYEITHDIDEWKNAWGKASKLRNLCIGISKTLDAEAIFYTPKEHLKELILHVPFNAGAEDVKKVMNVCAEGTKCVETFTFHGFGFYLDSAKDFLEQNKNSLASITIWGTYRDGGEKMDELLNSFLKLPALKKVYSGQYTMPTDTLKAIEKRGVYWIR